MLTFAATIKVYLALGATDMRKSFDGLAGSVRSLLAEDPLSGHLFAFCNRRRNMVKIIYWDGAGFWLVAKRLARGTFAWPSPQHDQPSLELRPDQLSALLGGVDLEKTTWQPWWRSSAGESPQLPAPPALTAG